MENKYSVQYNFGFDNIWHESSVHEDKYSAKQAAKQLRKAMGSVGKVRIVNK